MTKKIIVIGTDSTHCVAFARLLLEQGPWRIKTAIRDTRSSLEMSQNRYRDIEKQLVELGIAIVDHLSDNLAESADAFIIASVDASLHVSQFQKLVAYGKPIFIDKPVAYTKTEMEQIFELAGANGLEIMTSSSLRFSDSVVRLSSQLSGTPITRLELAGPMPLEVGIPGMYWYGIHLVELLLTLCPKEFQVKAVAIKEDKILIQCQAGDTECEIHGDLRGLGEFKGRVYCGEECVAFNQGADPAPLYSYLVAAMLAYFETGSAPVSPEQTRSVISLVEKINDKGGWL